VPTAPPNLPRCFKTKFFAKQARKAKITDKELCEILQELSEGKATDLGGGVFKKRLGKNDYRSFIVAKSDRYWVLEFLFAKKDADSITYVALDGFRTLADTYATLKPSQLGELLRAGDLKEICDGTTTGN
jgi:hypothetical protein